MKANPQLQQFKKCLILFFVGIICSALAYAVYVVNPLKTILEYNLKMSPSSMIFSLWQKPPVDVYIKVYIFNITNPDEFLAGEEKLRVEEVGPYVYQEVLENYNVTWNDNGTISYRPKRMVYFVPEMSVGDPKNDIVRVPNVPLLGISSSLIRESSFFVQMGLSHTINAFDIQTILNLTAYEYFWGYDDTLVELAGHLAPRFIDFVKFGLLDRMYDEGDNVFTMNIKKNENMTDEAGRYLSLETMNGNPGLSHWGYVPTEGNETNPANTVCNRLQGASEGTVFPTDIDRHAVFRIFRKAFCRAMPIEFIGEAEHSGLPGYMYNFRENFLEPSDVNPDNECYCREKGKCLKKGLLDMSPCYYTVPIAMSLPHFYKGDPSLVEDIEGLKPDEKLHGTKVIIQPDVGIPLSIETRVQSNLVMDHVDFNRKITPWSGRTIPLIWFDMTMRELPSHLLLLIKLAVVIMPIVQPIIIGILGIIGVVTFVLSLLGTLWIVHQQGEEDSKQEDTNDLKISLGYGQYSAIRILPATIKKITSRTDLFG